MTDPLVSICIPTYNAQKTIAETLRSVLRQTYSHLEVLVVDNASEDGTLQIVRQFDDPRIVTHRNKENVGGEGNFTKCVELATGQYIAVFHADDVYLPNMVSRQLQTFHENPSVAAVFTLHKTIDEDGKILQSQTLPTELRGRGLVGFDEVFVAMLRHGSFLTCPSAMVRADVYKKAIPFDSVRFGFAADLAMWLSIVEHHPIAVVEEHLMHYRVSGSHGSWTASYLRTQPADYFRVMDHYLSHTAGVIEIPRDALADYEFARVLDAIRCGKNHLIKEEVAEARRALRKTVSPAALGGAARSIRRPRLLVSWTIGVGMLCGISVGLGKHLRKAAWWLEYGRKKRVMYKWLRRPADKNQNASDLPEASKR